MRRLKIFSGYIGSESANEKMENEIHAFLDTNGYSLVTVKLTDNEENGLATLVVIYEMYRENETRH